jgi:hypothetical protein
MEVSQGNSLYSYIKQAKMSFFNKLREQEGGTGPVLGLMSVGRGRKWRKGVGG